MLLCIVKFNFRSIYTGEWRKAECSSSYCREVGREEYLGCVLHCSFSAEKREVTKTSSLCVFFFLGGVFLVLKMI